MAENQTNRSNAASRWLESINENARAAHAHFISHATKTARLAQEQIGRNLSLLQGIAQENAQTIQTVSSAHTPQEAAQAWSAGTTRMASRVLNHVQESATQARETLAELGEEAEVAFKASGEVAGDVLAASLLHAQEAAEKTRHVGEQVIQHATAAAERAREATEQAAQQTHETIQRATQHARRAAESAAAHVERHVAHAEEHHTAARTQSGHKTDARRSSAAKAPAARKATAKKSA